MGFYCVAQVDGAPNVGGLVAEYQKTR